MTALPDLDARLVPCAAAAWGVTALGLHRGSGPAGAVAVLACVAAGLLYVVCVRGQGIRQAPAAVPVVLAVCAVVAGFGTATGIRMWFTETHPVVEAAAAGGWASAVLEPTDDPKALQRVGFGGEAQVRIPAVLRHVTVDGIPIVTGGTVVVFAPADGWSDISPGQRVTARFRLSPITGPGTDVAIFRAEDPPNAVTSPPVWQRWAGTVRKRLAEACRSALPADQAGLLPGLVVGDTSRLEDGTRENFRIAGLTHLTAVSGANVSIVLGAVLLVVRAVGVGPRTGTAVAAVALVAFVIVVRPSASVVRAAAMGAIALLALVAGRERQALPALCGAVGALLVLDPDLAVDVGFALSVSATAGLVVLAPVVVMWLREHGWPRVVAEVSAVSGTAFAVTAPIVAAATGTVSLVSVAANILVAPVVAPLTVLGSGVAVAATAHSGAGEVLATVAAPFLWWMLGIAERAAAVPSAEVAVPEGATGAVLVGVVASVICCAARYGRVRVVVGVALLAAAAVWLPVRLLQPGWPGDGWVLVACDVGQGDALILATDGGGAVVVDAGAEPEPVDRCLRRLRIRSVSMLVVTHLHADHTGGVPGVLRGRDVASVVVGPGAADREGATDLARVAARHGVEVREVGRDDVLVAGATTIRVIGPVRPGYAEENDLSLVLVADTPVGRILLPGDAEEAALDALVRSGADVRADVLKVPHHGSRTTPTRFFTAVRPRVAVVSAGRDNTFGHPHPQTIAALRALGARVLSTDRHGDVAVVRAGSGALAVVSDRRDTIEP
ncbi:ComEC/Rec2 family competence protein [Rhodococcus coprophilus]|uniref:DNA internalization competence protein comec/rec2 n=1 Tax=Rhodococcus coprophilus TaxID=38310 RepID=A0A2X4UTN0_9NOCA|nr:ComEC/Rec2 family competence protein [Rhodococcus coprophilus]MBM7460305.1 competence protein ComEC [Rhodococcus coprophilus]SQI38998.1 DNA internalization competence protein comec/rec2 [Rhodococcus coprophilus]